MLVLILLLQLFQRQFEVDLGVLVGRIQLQRLLIGFDSLFKGLLLKIAIAHIVVGLGANFFPRCLEYLREFLQSLFVIPVFEQRVAYIKMQFGRVGSVDKCVAIEIERSGVLTAAVVLQCRSTFLHHRIAHGRRRRQAPHTSEHRRTHPHAKRPFHSRERTRASPRKASAKKHKSAANSGHWKRSS